MSKEIEILREVADRVTNGRFYSDYSGRGMYGKTCASIYCDDTDECIEEAAAAGIRGARRDSMGLGAVVYWPHITVTE
jgi:hypothetical protein